MTDDTNKTDTNRSLEGRSSERIKRKIELYLEKARPLFENVEFVKPKKDIDIEKTQRVFYEMASAYYSDAKHFFKKKEYANALAALEYAEGWLDSGRRLGIFKIVKRKE